MTEPAGFYELLRLIKNLNHSIEIRDYEGVSFILEETDFPLNFDFNYNIIPLPLDVMLKVGDPEMARLFLKCPRVDWLAPSWNRSMEEREEQCGIQYEPGKPRMNKKNGQSSSDDYLDLFYCLGRDFESSCPEEAHIIYEKIIEELVTLAKSETYEPNKFLCITADSLMAFKIALKYSTNIGVKTSCGKPLLV